MYQCNKVLRLYIDANIYPPVPCNVIYEDEHLYYFPMTLKSLQHPSERRRKVLSFVARGLWNLTTARHSSPGGDVWNKLVFVRLLCTSKISRILISVNCFADDVMHGEMKHCLHMIFMIKLVGAIESLFFFVESKIIFLFSTSSHLSIDLDFR